MTEFELRRAVLEDAELLTAELCGMEFRDGGTPESGAPEGFFTMTGHAAVFNHVSGDVGGFKEVIMPGAFREAARSSRVHLLINHDENRVLASTDSGTLQLREDEEGLRIFAKIPKDLGYARDLRTLFQLGISRDMSFAFRLPPEGAGESWSRMEDGTPLRSVKKVLELRDVSAVTTRGAYAAPAFAMRSLLEAAEARNAVEPWEPAGGHEDRRAVDSAGEARTRLRLRAAATLALHPERI